MKFECDERTYLLSELLRLKSESKGGHRTKYGSEKITRGDRRTNCTLEVSEAGLIERNPETDEVNAVYEYRNCEQYVDKIHTQTVNFPSSFSREYQKYLIFSLVIYVP